MVSVLDAANYVCVRYQNEFGVRIDEMKLHKLLYFAQREAFIQNDAPLFDAVFYGWRYGPVLKEIRDAYQRGSFGWTLSEETLAELNPVMNAVFSVYATKDSWSLSSLSHGELSWKNSRIGVGKYESSDNPIATEDIRQDARRIVERKQMLQELNYLS